MPYHRLHILFSLFFLGGGSFLVGQGRQDTHVARSSSSSTCVRYNNNGHPVIW